MKPISVCVLVTLFVFLCHWINMSGFTYHNPREVVEKIGGTIIGAYGDVIKFIYRDFVVTMITRDDKHYFNVLKKEVKDNVATFLSDHMFAGTKTATTISTNKTAARIAEDFERSINWSDLEAYVAQLKVEVDEASASLADHDKLVDRLSTVLNASDIKRSPNYHVIETTARGANISVQVVNSICHIELQHVDGDLAFQVLSLFEVG